MRKPRRVRFLSGSVVFLLASIAGPPTVRAADGWLSDSEREFFSTFQVAGQAQGKALEKAASFSALPAIAARAPQPLGGRIEKFAAALDKLRPSEDQKARAAAYANNVQRNGQAIVAGAFLEALRGGGSLDSAVRLTDSIAQGTGAVAMWTLQADLLERSLDGRQEAQAALDEITRALEERLGKTRPASDFGLSMSMDDKRLLVAGKLARSPATQPIIEITCYRKPAGRDWVAANAGAGLLARVLGVQSIDADAQREGVRLAQAQQRQMNEPIRVVMLLPDLREGDQFRVNAGLSRGSAPAVDHVEVRIRTGEGWLVVNEVAGLGAVQKRAQALAEQDRKKAIAERQKTQKRALAEQQKANAQRKQAAAKQRRTPARNNGR